MLAEVDQRLYMRLYEQLNEGRHDSAVADECARSIGAPAYVIRGMSRARRHLWAGARADFGEALARNRSAPRPAGLVDFVAGVGSFIARDYSQALDALGEAARCNQPRIQARARALASDFADALGWAAARRRLAPADEAEAHASTVDEALALRFCGAPERAAEALDALAPSDAPPSPEWVDARVRVDLLLGDPAAAHARVDALSPSLRESVQHARALLALERGEAKAIIVRTAQPRPADDGDEAANPDDAATDSDPAALYLRGRALMLLGEPGEAARTLEAARVLTPTSVPILLALTLARYTVDPDTFLEDFERRFETLADWAPTLLGEAAAALGRTLWTDNGLLADRHDCAELLARAQELLVDDGELVHASYRHPDSGELRHLPRVSLSGTTHDHLHADDGPRLAQIEALFVRALGIHPPRPKRQDPGSSEARARARRSEPWTPQFLDAEQIERFLTDGYLVIEGAFDPAVAQRWREGGERRVREDPARWVRGYDPEHRAGRLDDFEIARPSTWSWPRIEILGDETLDIAELSPKGWAAICDILGGPDRIKTKTWKNYLILNLSGDAHLGQVPPEPHWSSWHIDDPGPLTRLDAIRNGLVCITVVSDLQPLSGNTWLAVDSPQRVIHELAHKPGGVDFANNRGTHITRQCARFHEVMGKAGDLYITHPLMMHSSAPNASGRPRWMGNPMVYLERPFNPFRPAAQLSLVEQSMRRVLEDTGTMERWVQH